MWAIIVWYELDSYFDDDLFSSDRWLVELFRASFGYFSLSVMKLKILANRHETESSRLQCSISNSEPSAG